MERKKRKENCLSGERKKCKLWKKVYRKTVRVMKGKKYEGNCFRYLTFLAF